MQEHPDHGADGDRVRADREGVEEEGEDGGAGRRQREAQPGGRREDGRGGEQEADLRGAADYPGAAPCVPTYSA
jgi:hypothetical protein